MREEKNQKNPIYKFAILFVFLCDFALK